ncbi:FAD binding domain-containing protein [Algihabitans albus]|uniref:FAD binding domain-containing protein n=1 Tax=Algihabitans albus TaxID=2164067 RepID=UPI000E5D6DFF|nr:FAD binding domain-containing protein [Algihabitans albus]
MKPAPFDYFGAGGLEDAMAALSGGAAKPMAGNQSLGPMLNLRLARPAALVDVSLLPELRGVEEGPDWVRLGAAVTHAEIEDGEVPDPTPGWLQAVAANIAYRAVRNRGTLGGSLAHADPAADWCVVMTGLGAMALLDGPEGPRRVAVERFLTGPFATDLRGGEILTAVEVPLPGEGARWGYWKFMRQVGEFAKASAAVLVDPGTGRVRCVLGALGRQPLLLGDPQAIVDGRVEPAEAVRAALPERAAADLALHVTALARALAEACGGAA